MIKRNSPAADARAALVLLLGGGDVRALLRGMARRAGPPVPVVPERIVLVLPLVRRGAALFRGL
jgi:hypothetical protein